MGAASTVIGTRGGPTTKASPQGDPLFAPGASFQLCPRTLLTRIPEKNCGRDTNLSLPKRFGSACLSTARRYEKNFSDRSGLHSKHLCRRHRDTHRAYPAQFAPCGMRERSIPLTALLRNDTMFRSATLGAFDKNLLSGKRGDNDHVRVRPSGK